METAKPRDVMEVSLRLVDEKTRFAAQAKAYPEIVIDTYPPFGKGEGYPPTSLVLVALVSCAATGIVTLLRDRMRKTVSGFAAVARGHAREEHPKAFYRIDLHFTIASPDALEAEIERAIDSAERKICPVWAMLRGNVEVQATFTLER